MEIQLILCDDATTLLNSLIISELKEVYVCVCVCVCVCVLASLVLFYVDNHVICKEGQFWFLLSDLYTFYFFSCLFALEKTSGNTLNKSVLCSDHRRKAFSLSLLSIILAIGSLSSGGSSSLFLVF